jgi:hypothetical protein
VSQTAACSLSTYDWSRDNNFDWLNVGGLPGISLLNAEFFEASKVASRVFVSGLSKFVILSTEVSLQPCEKPYKIWVDRSDWALATIETLLGH